MATISTTGRSAYYFDQPTDTLVPVGVPGADGADGRDLVIVYNTVAERDAAAPVPEGSMCVTLDYDVLWMRGATGWFFVEGDTLLRINKPFVQLMGTGWQAPTWTEQVSDPLNMWVSGGPSNRFTIPAGFGGTWVFQFSLDFANAGGPRRAVAAVCNGTGQYIGSTVVAANLGFTTTLATCAIVVADAGDYIEARCYQDSGANLNVGGPNSKLSAQLLGPSTAMTLLARAREAMRAELIERAEASAEVSPA